MENNAGIIYDKFIQTKMLILFVMSRLQCPVSAIALTDLTMCDERISYFDVTECIPKLEKTKHLQLTDGKYTLTAKGLRNSEILEKDLPYSIRQKAEIAVKRINEVLARDSLVSTCHDTDSKGAIKVKLSLSDGVGEILHIELVAANERQAEKLEKGFRKNAHSLYRNIEKIITE